MSLEVILIGVFLKGGIIDVGLWSISEIEVLDQLVEVSDFDGLKLFFVFWELEDVWSVVLLEFLDKRDGYFKSGMMLLQAILFDKWWYAR